MNKKHFIRFNQKGETKVMPLRLWARENPHYFPNFGFTNNTADHPTTHYVRNFCVRELGADLEEDIDTVTVIIQ